jgi:hypothetical protein
MRKKDLPLVFPSLPADCREWRQAETLGARHGRIEPRVVIASSERKDCLSRDWPASGQVCFLRRRFPHRFTCPHQMVFGFPSLTPTRQGQSACSHASGHPWAIENTLHSRRAVPLREDACHVRKGQAPSVLAMLTSGVLALFDWLTVRQVASPMPPFAA